ncbi:SDR family oxidoreductase [Amycolatopsis sp.]|uniref:SDR family oxidoreductase n=1 Tax=Amycolatopsis sp. TaxID=37632 RepID=UPI002E093039|nr:SDR family oxidoreductase [Amycolatopsis sp.]
MTIVVTGATGQLGRAVVKHLLARVPADQVVASVRDPKKAADLGVEAREGDFLRPETLATAFAGADKLLIISSQGDTESRLLQHTNAVDAAKAAGVGHIVYTSITKADTNKISLADTHRPTEEAIKASGIPYTFLRNNWYFENDFGTVLGALATGKVATPTQGGKVASATRDDFANAAAAVLATEGHENMVYELGGTAAHSYADWAEAIGAAAGREIAYEEITPDESAAALAAAGVPADFVPVLIDAQLAIARGELDHRAQDLAKLIGREPVGLREWVAGVVKAQQA